jgi:hypothetical protein
MRSSPRSAPGGRSAALELAELGAQERLRGLDHGDLEIELVVRRRDDQGLGVGAAPVSGDGPAQAVRGDGDVRL